MPTPQGWMLASKTVTDSGSNQGEAVLMMRTEVLNGKIRVTTKCSGTPEMYSIFDSAAHTIANVLPSSSWASIGDMPALGEMTRMSESEMVGEPELVIEDLGPGERMLGYATRHYRYTTEFSMKYTIGDSTRMERSIRSTEAWIAPDVVMSPLGMSAEIARILGGGADPVIYTEYVDKLAALVESKIKGTALKTIVERPDPTIPGDSANVVVTMEVTELAHGVDPSVFEIPPGFQLIDMRKMTAKRPV